MTARGTRPLMPAFVKALLALMFGILAGGVFNYLLGDQGADTPAFAIYGGALALAIFIAVARYKIRKTRKAGSHRSVE